jgi:uncharacterized damage-inducible protein DinB
VRPITSYYPKSVFTGRYPGLDEATTGLDGASEGLCSLLEKLSDDALQQRAASGKWSTAEVADHLVLVNEVLARSVSRACFDLPPVVLPQGYLSDEGKALSPAQSEPRAGRTRSELLVDVRRTAADLIEQAERAGELERLDVVGLVHSFFGEMTALECLQLAAWHTERHVRRLG